MTHPWRDIFEIASREPHFRILRAASPGVWFDHAAAAKANRSSKQSISRPLGDLEERDLLVRRRKGRGEEYLLTGRGEAVRGVLFEGPPLLSGSWVVTVALAEASPGDVRSALMQSPSVAVLRCAGDFDFVAQSEGGEPGEDVVDELVRKLQEAGTRSSRAYVVRPLVTPPG